MNSKALSTLKLTLVLYNKYLLLSCFTVFLLCASHCLSAQGTNQVYQKIKVGDAQNLFSGLALSPDGKTVVVSSNQSFPLNFYDLESQTVINRFDVGNWYAGSRADYSATGKYILLNQLYYMDWAPNKDREVNFEVVDASSGQSVKMFNNYNDVKISPDEKYAITLFSGEVSFWNLATGDKEKSFRVDQATNSIAISPDGSKIAVSHHTYMEDLKNNPMWVNNKKNRINLEKYKQNITVYDVASLQPLYIVDEFYDIVYRMKYSEDGKYLFVYSIPHTKLQTTGDRKSYVSTVNGVTGEPLRNAFPSMSVYEPDFSLSHDGKYFGISTLNGKFQEVHLYDFQSGNMLFRFELGKRLFEKSDEAEFANDGRISFVFLPDDSKILMTNGNRLILWNIDQ